MNGSLRVVLVVPTYLPETFGGAEQQTRRLADGLTRSGCDVSVLAPRLKRTTPSTEIDGLVRVHRFHLWAAPNLGGAALCFLRGLVYAGYGVALAAPP